MRVAQINTCSYGSTGQISKGIHSELQERGDESLLAYGFGPDITIGGFKISNKADRLIHSLLSYFCGLHAYASAFTTYRLIRRLKKFKPDIIHLHNIHGGYLNMHLFFKYIKKENIKTVITLHDCWLFTGKCYHYYEAGCDRYLHNCGNCPQLEMYPKSCFFDFTTKMLKDKKALIEPLKCVNIVTVSEWLKSQAEATFLGRFPINVIKNGVKEQYGIVNEAPKSNVYKELKGKFVILGVASIWGEHKGINDFIELSSRLSDGEKILLVGTIPDKKKLPKNIYVIDRTENVEELVRIYNASNVYVSMSTEETFGLTIAEAMCCGVPSIVYNATACKEMVIPGQNGYIAQPHCIDEVYDFIQKIKNKSFDREAMSRETKDRYSMPKMVDSYLSLYTNIYNSK